MAGKRGKVLQWIMDFSTDREHRVILHGVAPITAPVTSGIPQGSAHEPIWFLMYVNDLPDFVSSKVKLFADDSKLYREVKNI